MTARRTRFHIASDEEIASGKVTDVYFTRVKKVIVESGIDKRVAMEVRASSLPRQWSWAVLCGLEELTELVKDLPVTVRAMPEGSVFYQGEPVVSLEGMYTDFAVYETAILGLLCQASGIATQAARCKKAAGGKPIFSFGARRMHPAIAPMIERSAYIGGCDGVATIAAAEAIGLKAIGTMAHALMLVVGDDEEAWRLFDECLESDIPRIALVDTFRDEKFASLSAASVLGKRLAGVRLDTPSSRRGNIAEIAKEVRWELDIRGRADVKIFLSGGLNEESLSETREVADAFGVGTAISNAPVVDFAMDIVEVEGEPLTKRGKTSGLKQVHVCRNCRRRATTLEGGSWICGCDKPSPEPLLRVVVDRGSPAGKAPTVGAIRDHCLSETEGLQV